AAERRVVDLSDYFGIARIFAAEAPLIGEEQVEMFAVPQRAVKDQTADGGQVVRLQSQSVGVPLVDLYVLDLNLAELGQRAARRRYAGRDVLEPGPIRGDLYGLTGLRRTALLKNAL